MRKGAAVFFYGMGKRTLWDNRNVIGKMLFVPMWVPYTIGFLVFGVIDLIMYATRKDGHEGV